MKQYLSFPAKHHLLRLFSQIRIKNHLDRKVQLLITVESLSKVAAIDLMSLTTGKRDVSLAKSLQFEDTPFDKSLM